MTLRMFTAEQQIEALENLIRDARLGRRPAVSVEVVKSIVEDIRARFPEESGETLGGLQRLLADAAASRTALGWSAGSMQAIAQFVIGRWPRIRQSLERFEAELTEVER
jgi:RecA/RadA recombinase